MNKKTIRLAGWALGLTVVTSAIGLTIASVHQMFVEPTMVIAAEDDTHDFSQDFSQLLNNNASIANIEIAEQSYAVKKVTLSYRYNKTIENAVTMTVTVGGVNWGSEYTVGTGSNYTTVDFTGSAVKGAIVISFTNNTGSGTGHGTFYVNNVELTEGSSKSLSSIAVKNAPNTSYYKDECFNPAGLAITATYSDSSTEDVAYSGNENKFTFTPSLSALLAPSNTSVTIGYGGKTVSQSITVTDRSITDISFYGSMAKTSYVIGDAWDYDGIKLKITYDKGDARYVDLQDAIDESDIEVDASPASPEANVTSVTISVAAHLYDYEGEISDKSFSGISVLANYNKIASLSDVTVGDSFVIGVAGKKEVMGAKSGTVRSTVSASTQMNDAKTQVSASLPSGAVVVTVLQGSQSGKFYVYDITNDKYLQGSDSKTNLNDASSLSDATEYTFTYSNSGDLSMLLTSRVFAYNYNGGTNPRFGSYSDLDYETYTRPVLFKASGSEVKDSVRDFTNTFLKMNDSNYDGDKTTVNCATNYSAMVDAYSDLTDAEKNVLQYSSDFSAARLRMTKWAEANHQTFTYGDATPFKAAYTVIPFANTSESNNATFAIVAIISSTGLIGASAFVIARRKSED